MEILTKKTLEKSQTKRKEKKEQPLYCDECLDNLDRGAVVVTSQRTGEKVYICHECLALGLQLIIERQ